jgi:hypothetical protein
VSQSIFISIDRLETLCDHRKLSTISIYEPTRLDYIRLLVTFVATAILTTTTLIIKWNIIQPIHDEIVDKFNKNESLFFQRHAICRVINVRQDFNIITFPVACLLLVIFSLITRRVSFKKGRGCRGYIGLPIPLDFFTHVKRTFAAVIFAISADELFDIAKQLFSRNKQPSGQGI